MNEENLETGEVIPGEWRQNIPAFTPLEISKSRKTAVSAKTVRDVFKDYFMGLGQVEWQWKMIKNFPGIVSGYFKKHTTLIIKCETF